SGDGRKLWGRSKDLEEVRGYGEGRRAPEVGSTKLWRRQEALEAYTAHRILVTHPPLPAIHLLPAIHALLHVMLVIDPRPPYYLRLLSARHRCARASPPFPLDCTCGGGLDIWRHGGCAGTDARSGGLEGV